MTEKTATLATASEPVSRYFRRLELLHVLDDEARDVVAFCLSVFQSINS
jgi:hypothetical protein